MGEAYIIDAVRTPVGRRGGGLAGIHSADLGAHVLSELMHRTGIDPAAVDDVVMGCVDAIGPQASDVARTAWLVAGLPESVPGVTIDRQCGSSQQAVQFAAQATASGYSDLVVAAGLQSMSNIPMSASRVAAKDFGFDDPFTSSPGWRARYGSDAVSQFSSAEAIAKRWGIEREEMEEFALASHDKALAAMDAGSFDAEIVPVGDFGADECPRRGSSLERLAKLPTLVPDGRLTAGTSSQISDGAAAILVASERAVEEHGLVPRARIVHASCVGDDPVLMLTAPIPATRRALDRSGLRVDDIDVYECNEAFAPVVIAWQRDTGVDPARVNVNGGAIALGHPIGATGARIMTSMLHELERRRGRYALQTMCEGGGQANVTIIERLG
ncbi:MAG: acetyl-CoA C-acetyltransferase [Acidimicrobiales bacterium]|nr:acetyl-CoA C-acetyltransferase [Acidimicrobiales bacterium]